MRALLALPFLFLVGLHANAESQISRTLAADETQGSVVAAPVKVQLHIEPTEISPGGDGKLEVDFSVPAFHHVFKDSIKIKPLDSVAVSEITVSPISKFFDPFSKRERDTIEDQATASATFQISKDNAPGPKALRFLITYQACSAKYCQFPKTVELAANVKILSPNGGEDMAKLASQSGKSESLLSGNFTQALSRGKLWAYIFVFIGGILTSFTPCIFPMIPITISIIGARSAKDKKSKAFLLSLAYVLGIALTYSVLGLVAAKTGSFFGSLLGNIWVVGFISLVFLTMGLSMLGLFELQAPAFIRNSLGTTRTGNGFTGAFFAGLISGIVASPCIGPVLVGLLTFVAQSAQPVFGFTLLFTFAIGMGLIFLVVGTFSGLLSHLPKSGTWMDKIKVVFGVVLIAMAVYYTKPFWKLATPQTSHVVNSGQMHWQNYSEKLVTGAAQDHKPVIIDFWADWCLACHELDEKTYTSSKVADATKDFVLLKFNATEQTPENEAVLKKYGVVGLPTVIFIDSQGIVKKHQNITGFVPPDEFISHLK